MFLILQIAVLTSLLTYLWQCRTNLRRRNLETWQSLSLQLEQYPSDSSTPWARFQNARILLEMVDYAEIHADRNSDLLDRVTIAAIRKDAMALRLSLLETIAKSAVTRRAA